MQSHTNYPAIYQRAPLPTPAVRQMAEERPTAHYPLEESCNDHSRPHMPAIYQPAPDATSTVRPMAGEQASADLPKETRKYCSYPHMPANYRPTSRLTSTERQMTAYLAVEAPEMVRRKDVKVLHRDSYHLKPHRGRMGETIAGRR